MILYPAIDIKDGRAVRLTQGRYDAVTVFNEDPAAQAQIWERAGFSWLHVVDLDGALGGAPVNSAAVTAILRAVRLPVQLGGGVRDLARVEAWLAAGVARVILGTAAVRDPDLVRQAARAFPGRIVVGIDARDGVVAVQGWTQAADMTALDLARRLEDAGAAAIVVTDIGRDGLKTGVNQALTGALADAVATPVIASGGLKDVADIRALKARPGRPIAGAILGRALYDAAFTPAQALEAAA